MRDIGELLAIHQRDDDTSVVFWTDTADAALVRFLPLSYALADSLVGHASVYLVDIRRESGELAAAAESFGVKALPAISVVPATEHTLSAISPLFSPPATPPAKYLSGMTATAAFNDGPYRHLFPSRRSNVRVFGPETAWSVDALKRQILKLLPENRVIKVDHAGKMSKLLNAIGGTSSSSPADLPVVVVITSKPQTSAVYKALSVTFTHRFLCFEVDARSVTTVWKDLGISAPDGTKNVGSQTIDMKDSLMIVYVHQKGPFAFSDADIDSVRSSQPDVVAASSITAGGGMHRIVLKTPKITADGMQPISRLRATLERLSPFTALQRHSARRALIHNAMTSSAVSGGAAAIPFPISHAKEARLWLQMDTVTALTEGDVSRERAHLLRTLPALGQEVVAGQRPVPHDVVNRVQLAHDTVVAVFVTSNADEEARASALASGFAKKNPSSRVAAWTRVTAEDGAKLFRPATATAVTLPKGGDLFFVSPRTADVARFAGTTTGAAAIDAVAKFLAGTSKGDGAVSWTVDYTDAV